MSNFCYFTCGYLAGMIGILVTIRVLFPGSITQIINKIPQEKPVVQRKLKRAK